MMGAQASQIQKDKILSYINLGKEEGAEVLTGGDVNNVGEGLEDGFYIQPTLFRGNNKMRIFQEEIFGPVLAVTTFKDEEEADCYCKRYHLWIRSRCVDTGCTPVIPYSESC